MRRQLLTSFYIFVGFAISSVTSFAQTSVPERFTYQGRITTTGSVPVEDNDVDFTVQIISPGAEECVLFEEQFNNVDMTGSNGLFSLNIGTGTRSGSDYEDTTALSVAFNNQLGNLTGLTCAVGSSYDPAAGETRELRLTFVTPSTTVTLAQDLVLNSVPFSMQAYQLQGLGASDFIQVVNDATNNLTQANINAIFTPVNYAELMALIGGTTSQYVTASGGNFAPTGSMDFNSQRIVNLQDPTAASDAATKQYTDGNIGGSAADSGLASLAVGDADKVLVWSGTQWVAQATGMPTIGGGDAGRFLRVNAGETGYEFIDLGSAAYLNAGTSSGDVPILDGSGDVPLAAIPGLPASQITSGVLPINRGGTGQAAIPTCAADEMLRYNGTSIICQSTTGAVPGGAAGGDLTGTYPNPTIAANAVDSAKIAADTIVAADIATGGVESAEIADGTIVAADIATGAVETTEILDGTIATVDLANDAVTSAKIDDGTIVAADLAVDSVDAAEIAADAVGASEISTGAVGSDEIADGSIADADVNDVSVSKITSGAGAYFTYQPNNVSCADGEVLKWDNTNTRWSCNTDISTPTGAAGGDLTGTYPNPTIANNAVDSAAINDGSITADDLATDSVEAAEIAAGAVGTSELASGAVFDVDVSNVGVDKIINGAGRYFGYMPNNVECGSNEVLKWNVVADQWECGTDISAPTGAAGGDLTGTYPNPTLAAGVVDTAELAADAVDSSKIAADTIVAADLAANSVEASELADNAVDTNAIAANAVTSAKINDGTIVDADINDVNVAKITSGAGNYFTYQPNNVACADGQVLQWDNTNTRWICAAAGGAPSGSAGGDLTGTYPNPTLAAGVVDTAELAADAVDSSKIAADTIVAADLAANSVEASELADNAVDTNAIANSAVTDAKIAGVGVSKIANGAGEYFAYQPNNVACADGQILSWDNTNTRWVCATDSTAPTGAAGGDLTGTYPNPTLAAGVVDTAELAADAVDSSKIAADTIVAADLAANSVEASELADNAVDTNAIAASAVTDAKINDVNVAKITSGAGNYFTYQPNNVACADGQVLSWDNTNTRWICAAAGGAPTGSAGGDLTGTYPNPTLAAGVVDTAELAADAVDSSKIAADTIVAADLAANSVEASELADNAVDTNAIANSAVTDAKIAGVGVSKIANGAGEYFAYQPNNVACADGQVLQWDNTNTRWICAAAGGAPTGSAGGDLTGTYPNPTLAAGVVDTAELAADAVDSSKIAADTIVAADLAANSVEASELADNAVDTNAIANSAVTDAKIAGVDVSKIASGAGSYFTYQPNNVSCADGEVLKWDNTNTRWACATDAGASGSISSINGETGAAQTFAVPGTAGTAPAWSSSSNTHTLNIPMAATATVTAGLISKTQYDDFDQKVDPSRSLTAGTGLTGGGDLSADRTFNVDVGTTANKIVQLDGSARLPAVDGSLLTNLPSTAPSGSAGGDLTGTYPNPTLAAGVVDTAELAADAVDSSKIAADTIVAADLAANSVEASELADNAVDTNAIAASAVTNAKINDVNVAKITSGAGNYFTYQPNNVACADGQVLSWDNTNTRWVCAAAGGAPSGSAGGDLTGTYPNPTLAAGVVDTAELAADAVDSSKIAADTIVAADLAANSVEASELADNAVDTNAIAANAVTSAKINDGTIVDADINDVNVAKITSGAGNYFTYQPNNVACADGQVLSWDNTNTRWVCAAAGGAPTGSAGGDLTGTYPNPTLAAGVVDTAELAADAVDSSKIAADTIVAADLAANSVEASELADNAVDTNAIAASAVTDAKIAGVNVAKISSGAGNYFTYQPNNVACADQEILKWNNASTRWECAADAGAGGGLTSLNGLTNATQTFATPGTAGTAPAWSSAGSAHTLNIPMAATATVTAGLISKTQYDAFDAKYGAGSTILAGDGSAAAPGIAFNSDADTGFYYQANNHIRIAADGTWRGGIDDTLFYWFNNIEAERFGVGDGVVGTPGLYFTDDSNSGIYSPANDNVGIVTAGSERLRVSATGETMLAEIAAPTVDVANFGKLYVNSADSKIYFRADDSTVYDLTATGGAPSGAAGGDLSGTYPNPTLAAGVVDTAELAADAVDSSKIAADTIVAADIAANAIEASELADNAVDTGAIAASAVTDAKINDVNVSKIASGAGNYFTYQPNNVACADGQVLEWDNTNTRWVCATVSGAPSGAAGGDLSGTYPNPTLAAGVVDTAELAADAVDSSKIAADTIVAADLAANSVEASELADNAVDTNAIAANAVTSAKINDGTIVNADIGGVNVSKIGSAAGEYLTYQPNNVACSDQQVLKWSTANTRWECGADAGAGGGLTSLNGETGAGQTFGVPGTSGTAPAWSSSSNTHTLNIPMAATATVTAGLISKTQYDDFDQKVDPSRSLTAGTGLTGGGDLSADRTFNVDVGTTANKIVQLDGSARLPAVDGSLLTNLPSTAPSGSAGGDLSGTYPNPTLAAGVVDTAELAADAVDSSKIAADTIVAADLAANSVEASELADNAVDTNAIAANAVTSAKINDGTIVDADINDVNVSKIASGAGNYFTYQPNNVACADGQVLSWDNTNTRWVCAAAGGAPSGSAGGDLTGTYPNPTLGSGVVDTAELAADAVDSSKIAADTIVAADLAANSVEASELADNAVDTNAIAANAVTSAKINDGTIVDADINDVNVSKIASGAGNYFTYQPNNVACADGQVLSWDNTNTRWICAAAGGAPSGSAGGDLTGTYPNPTLAAGVVDTAELAADAVDSSKIAADTIVAADLAANSVEASELADNAVDTNAIAASAVTDAKIAGVGINKISNGAGLYFTYQPNNTACTDGQILEWSTANTRWECANDDVGGAGGLSSLNGETGASQTFGTPGTSGTAPSWSSSSNVHTLNIPMAATATVTAGLISKTQYDNFDAKVDPARSLTAGTGLTGGGDLSADRTFNVDVGTTANKIVQLDGSARLPAVDGSLLTNLPSGAPSGAAGGDLSGTYPNPTLASGVVDTAELAADAVDSSKIAADTIVAADLAANSVEASELADNAVDTNAIAASAVTDAKINDVNVAKITSGAGNYFTYQPNNVACSNNEILKWNNASTRWECGTDDSGGAPSGAAGGDLSGTYPNPTLASGVVDTAELAADAVDSSKIAADTIVAADLAANSVEASELADNAVDTNAIAANAVTSAKINDGTIVDADIGGVNVNKIGSGAGLYFTYQPNNVACADGQVLAWDNTNTRWSCAAAGGAPSGAAGGDLSGTYPNPTLASGVVDTAELAADAVDSSKIAADTIVAADLAANSVEASELADNAVDTNAIANSAVTDAKIAAVGVSKIANGAGEYFAYQPNNVACSDGQVLKWDNTNTRWSCDNDAGASGTITTINGETGTSQSFGVPGTSGTAPAWSSSSNVHTLNIPMAATATVTAGLISKTQYDNFDAKVDPARSLTAGTGLTGGGDLSADRTFNVDVGTTANKIVQLDGSARLPAVDGSLLTNLPSGAPSGAAGGDLSGTYPNPTLASGVVDTAELAADAVDSSKIAADTIVAADLAANSVEASELADNAVDTNAIAANAVTSAKINDGTIVDADINDVNVAKITSGAGNYFTYQPNNVACADGQVLQWDNTNTRWICAAAGGAPTGSAGGDLTGTYPNPTLAAGVVDTAELAADAVDSSKIAADTIVAADIATGAVETTEILDGTITTTDMNTTNVDARYVNLSGDTMGGSLNMGTHTLAWSLSNFYVESDIGNGNPGLHFDSNDYIDYNRTTNIMSFSSAGGERMNLDSGGANVTGTLDATGDIGVPSGIAIQLANGSADNTKIERDGTNNGMALFAGSSTRLFLGDDGDVGIGTSTPGAKFEIADGANDNTDYGSMQVTRVAAGHTGSHISLIRAGNSVTGIGYAQSSNMTGIGPGTTGAFSPSWLAIDPSTGNVSIGSASAGSYKLDVTGDARVTGSMYANAFFYTSDARFKKDVEDAAGLETILNLRGVNFKWKKDGSPELGLIAQEVEAVLPDLVHTNSEGYKSVKYGNIVAPLIESTKELYEMSVMSKEQIADIDSRVKENTRRIASVESVQADQSEDISEMKSEMNDLREENAKMRKELDELKRMIMENRK